MGDICFQKGIAYNTLCTVPKVGSGPISHKGKYNESPSYLFELNFGFGDKNSEITKTLTFVKYKF
jgi:hypothetical protein